MADAELRQLKIKTGSLTRLTKELVLYEKEHKQEQERVAAMKSDKADAHDIKHAENVLSEAGMMIPDTRSRVEAALQDLTACMDSSAADAKAAEEFKVAGEAVATAQKALGDS